jgi:hypothetical protein
VYTGVEVITADTSFSDTSQPDNRGAAILALQVSPGRHGHFGRK